MIHVVAGNRGQVGSALQQVLEKFNADGDTILGYDLEDLNELGPLDPPDEPSQLHITFGWSGSFTDQVTRQAELLGITEAIVIHSTVPPGTCDLHGWIHSPVRGRHPDLTEGLLTFTKHFGGQGAVYAAHPFVKRGIPVQVHPRALETELGKLVELAAFGAQVRIMREIYALCQQYGAEFSTVYTDMARTYNAGYTRLGEDRFVRPVLDFMPGPIGGHCIWSGTQILDDDFFTDLVEPMTRKVQ